MLDNWPQRVLVRRSVPADAPVIIAAIETVCREEIYFQTDSFVPDWHWETVLYWPDTTAQHLLAIAELDGEIIGSVRLFAGMCGTKDRHVAELGILVLPLYRDQGIGKRLMTYALAWANEQGLKKVGLCTFATNQRAIGLFRKFGFVFEATRKMQYNIRGEYVDEVLMSRFFS